MIFSFGFQSKWRNTLQNVVACLTYETFSLEINGYLIVKDQCQKLCLSEIEESPKRFELQNFKTEIEFENYVIIFCLHVLEMYFTNCNCNFQLRQEDDMVCLEMRDYATFATQMIQATNTIILCAVFFISERQRFITEICCINANTYNFDAVFNSSNVVILEKLCKFIKSIDVKVRPPSIYIVVYTLSIYYCSFVYFVCISSLQQCTIRL